MMLPSIINAFQCQMLLYHFHLIESMVESNNSRRRLPTLPQTRSPRNSIGGVGCSAAALIASGQHRNSSQASWDNMTLDTTHPDPSQGKFGWIQFSLVWEQRNLCVTISSAQNLLMMEDEHSFSLPQPYFIVRLYSQR